MRNVTSHPQDDVARQNYVLNGKIMLCSVIILVTAVFVIFGFHTYARCLLRRRHTRNRNRRHHYLFSSTDSAAPPQGLDLTVLKSLPTFAYSSAVHDPLLECAVCLSEFENDEAGRVLPKCNHTFHVDCIDMWFQSHDNCPLCRAPVQSDSVQISVHTIVLVHEPADLEAESCSVLGRKDETGDVGAGSSSTTAASQAEARLDLEGISVAETDPVSPGLKSPGNRILSLRRIWSV